MVSVLDSQWKSPAFKIIEWLKGRLTAQKMKFSIKDYFICFIFCAMTQSSEVNQMSTKILEVKR